VKGGSTRGGAVTGFDHVGGHRRGWARTAIVGEGVREEERIEKNAKVRRSFPRSLGDSSDFQTS